MRFTLATYNIQYGLGQDGRFDTRRCADVVAEADIICFQEVTQHWQRNAFEDQAAVLAEHLNRYYVFGSTFDLDASFTDPGGQIVNRRRTFGNLVVSRWPIRSNRTLPLYKPATPEHFDLQRCVVEAVVITPAGPIRIYSVHLSAVWSSTRLPQCHLLRQLLREAPETGAPFTGERDETWTEGQTEVALPVHAILAGDFNFRADADEYAVLCGDYHPRAGRIRHHDQLVDTWVAAGHEAGQGQTKDKIPEQLAKQGVTDHKIDYVLATPEIASGVKKSWIDGDAVASDHYPVFVEFDWEG